VTPSFLTTLITGAPLSAAQTRRARDWDGGHRRAD
jgi:hypothetical protein